MKSNEPILSIDNATVYRQSTQVFKGLSLQLFLGESAAIIGPNGSGKTTLLKLITREIHPVVKADSHIHLFGNEQVIIWELRQRIGLVSHEFQSDYRALASGREVVLSAFFGAVGIHQHHQVSDEQINLADAVMAQLDITDLADKKYLHLSTGQQRRLLLARALIHNPDVLIFDEPTNGLDIKSAFRLLNDMRRLCQQGTTLVLVTHHVHEIIPEIERVICLKEGEIVADGKKPAILNEQTISSVYDTPVTVTKNQGFYSVAPKSGV